MQEAVVIKHLYVARVRNPYSHMKCIILCCVATMKEDTYITIRRMEVAPRKARSVC